MGFFTKRDYYLEIKFSNDRSMFTLLLAEDTKGKEMSIDKLKSFSMTTEGKFPREIFDYIASVAKESPEEVKIHFNEITE